MLLDFSLGDVSLDFARTQVIKQNFGLLG